MKKSKVKSNVPRELQGLQTEWNPVRTSYMQKVGIGESGEMGVKGGELSKQIERGSIDS
jgi:hypothetical protein